jgi:hypothetical protein
VARGVGPEFKPQYCKKEKKKKGKNCKKGSREDHTAGWQLGSSGRALPSKAKAQSPNSYNKKKKKKRAGGENHMTFFLFSGLFKHIPTSHSLDN